MALYSEKVMDHFKNPRNVGVIENADGVGEVGNAKCGDIMKIYLKIDNDIITDVKFETFMLSLPNDWDYSINGLVAICKEGRSAIEGALSELKEAGYLEVIKLNPNESGTGRFEYVYNVYEISKTSSQKQDPSFLPLENHEEINTKDKDTKTKGKINKKKSRTVALEDEKDIYPFAAQCLAEFNAQTKKSYKVLHRHIANYLESQAVKYQIADIGKMIKTKADYFNAIKRPENIRPSTFFRESNFPVYMDEASNKDVDHRFDWLEEYPDDC